MALAEVRQLDLVLNLRDKASKELRSFGTELNLIKGALKGLAVGLVGAGVATGIFAKDAIQDANEMQGAFDKFNTVFGEGAKDMEAFVNEIRKTMPTARKDIIRLAADMQDLLVPMGLSRELSQDMSKGFLDVANKIGAFNDVDPTQVLESIKSGLAGSSEPLRRFGVNALESALEARALSEGLLKAGQSFKDLEPDVKAQIRAQALLAQITDNSSDAIAGFEKNNDSLDRRMLDLKATFVDVRTEMGTKLIPIVDAVAKKLLGFFTEERKNEKI